VPPSKRVEAQSFGSWAVETKGGWAWIADAGTDQRRGAISKAGSRGDQREDRGGWKIEVARRMGRSKAPSRVLAKESSGSTGKGSTPSPQSSARGGGCGLEVEGGADLFEHEGPEQGFGRGAWSLGVNDPSIFARMSRPMPGRSLGWSQLAFAEPGANRLIARNVKDAPTNARVSRFDGIGRMQ
jgi:hypothetical protein